MGEHAQVAQALRRPHQPAPPDVGDSPGAALPFHTVSDCHWLSLLRDPHSILGEYGRNQPVISVAPGQVGVLWRGLQLVDMDRHQGRRRGVGGGRARQGGRHAHPLGGPGWTPAGAEIISLPPPVYSISDSSCKTDGGDNRHVNDVIPLYISVDFIYTKQTGEWHAKDVTACG